MTFIIEQILTRKLNSRNKDSSSERETQGLTLQINLFILDMEKGSKNFGGFVNWLNLLQQDYHKLYIRYLQLIYIIYNGGKV